jgi:cytochrome c biogenesis protein CcmG/thiol:disulfide interchange protein DsbE
MHGRSTPWLAFCGIGCSLLPAIAGCASSRPTPMPVSASSHLLGKGLPDFQRPTLAEEALDTRRLRGRPIIVKFFAEYCEPCKRTLPAAERLHRANPGITFIGVSVDDYASTARQIASLYGLTFFVVHDPGKVLKGRFRVSDMPVTFLADGSGTVRWVGGPEQGERDLEQAIKAVQEPSD